nr:MAG TPA: hypothetical protein [Caudoviricetes sp.]
MLSELVYKFYEAILLLLTLICVCIMGLLHLVVDVIYGVTIFLYNIVSFILGLILILVDND